MGVNQNQGPFNSDEINDGNSGRNWRRIVSPVLPGSPYALGTLRCLRPLIIKLIITPRSARMFLLKASVPSQL